MRSIRGVGLAIGGLFAIWDVDSGSGSGGGQDKRRRQRSSTSSPGRLELTISHFPALAAHLARLPEMIGGRTFLLLVGIVVAGLAAEYLVAAGCSRASGSAGFGRLAANSALHGFWRAVLFDALAVVAFWVAGRLVLGQLVGGQAGDSQSVSGKLGQILLMTPDLLAGLQPGVSRLAAARRAGGPHRAGRRRDRAQPAGRLQPR